MTSRRELFNGRWSIANFVDVKPGTELESDQFVTAVGKFRLELHWLTRGNNHAPFLRVTVEEMTQSARYSIKLNDQLIHKNLLDKEVALELDYLEKLKAKLEQQATKDLDIDLRVTGLVDKDSAIDKLQTQLSRFVI